MTISINGVAHDPDADRLVGPPKTRYVVLARPATFDEATYAALDALAEVVEAVPGDGLVCRLRPGATLDDLTAAAGVSGFHYGARYKWRGDFPTSEIEVVVQVHDGQSKESVRAELQALGLAARIGGSFLTVRVPPDRWRETLAVEGIRHVEPKTPRVASAEVARQLVGAHLGHASGFDGAGQVVAFLDSGLDQGDPAAMHPELAGRVLPIMTLPDCHATDVTGHGTHLVSAACGSSGVAPGAKVLVHGAWRNNNMLAFDLAFDELFDHARAQGAHVYNYSFNEPGCGGTYSITSRAVDEELFARADLLVCVSAGNDGRSGEASTVAAGSIAPPATAKNVLAVGASESLRPEVAMTYGGLFPADFGAPPIRDDRFADEPEGLAAMSARGPATGDRLRPDVVAPGTCVRGVKSTARPTAYPTAYGTSADPTRWFDSGTSVASALVAGAAAIVSQWLVTRRERRPTATLLKALLVNGARPLAGQYGEAGVAPNNDQGFGRIDLEATLGLSGGVVQFHEGSLGPSGVHEVEVSLAGAEQLSATLVWADVAGEGLFHRFTLEVFQGAASCHGNRAPGDPSFDTVDNVQRVRWAVEAPTARLRVRLTSPKRAAFSLVWSVR